MPRRKELQGVCNDLLDSFVSRYNDLGGYWALGKMQAFLLERESNLLCFDLVDEGSLPRTHPFFATSAYYPRALRRLLRAKRISVHWVASGNICVSSLTNTDLECSIVLRSDLGREFSAKRSECVHAHDPNVEFQSAGMTGPQNQKGQ